MAVELIPKRPTEKPWWQGVLLYLSLGFVVLSLLTFGILLNLSQKATAEKDRLNQELAKEKTAEEVSLEQRIFQAQRQVTAFAYLINQQKPVSRVFTILEKLVHPQAYFSKFNFVANENKVWLSGNASSFQALGEQALLLKADENIEQANLAEVGIGKLGGVDFVFEVFFDPNLFQE